METYKNKLSPKEKRFLDGLSDYLDTKLIYYGSIQRSDYVHGKSDIDVNIFTDNEDSMMAKMQHYLHVPRNEFKKTVLKIAKSNRIVTGYKLKYKQSFINVEFSIYNDKYKQIIIEDHCNKITLPFYCSWMLQILKTLFYRLNIIPASYYIYMKRKIFTLCMGQTNDDMFIVI